MIIAHYSLSTPYPAVIHVLWEKVVDKSIAQGDPADYDVSGAKWGEVGEFGIPLATAPSHR